MPVSLYKIEKLKKKFKNVDIKVVEKSEDGIHVEVFAITYQKLGLPGKISPGLEEVNAIWDERKSRPEGYLIAHSIDKGNGVAVSIMVSEEWAGRYKISKKIVEWEQTL